MPIIADRKSFSHVSLTFPPCHRDEPPGDRGGRDHAVDDGDRLRRDGLEALQLGLDVHRGDGDGGLAVGRGHPRHRLHGQGVLRQLDGGGRQRGGRGGGAGRGPGLDLDHLLLLYRAPSACEGGCAPEGAPGAREPAQLLRRDRCQAHEDLWRRPELPRGVGGQGHRLGLGARHDLEGQKDTNVVLI